MAKKTFRNRVLIVWMQLFAISLYIIIDELAQHWRLKWLPLLRLQQLLLLSTERRLSCRPPTTTLQLTLRLPLRTQHQLCRPSSLPRCPQKLTNCLAQTGATGGGQRWMEVYCFFFNSQGTQMFGWAIGEIFEEGASASGRDRAFGWRHPL